MAPVQLLARAPSAGRHELEIVEPDPTLPVQAYERFERTAPGKPIRLGTEILLRIAVEMRELGYRTTHIDVVGSNFRALDESSETSDIVDHILTLVQDSTIDEILLFFQSVARGYFVTAVEMRSTAGDGGRVTVRRTGWLTVHNSKNVGAVTVSLQKTSRLVGLV